MRFSQTILVYAAGAAALFAQQGTINGPVTGYVFDAQSQALRAIRGIPGASLIGDPLDLGAPVASAWVSPKSDSVLIVTAEHAPRLFRLDGGQATERKPEGMVAPERAVFSPSGSALAVVTPGSVRIYKGLPDAPVVAGTVELPADRVAAGGMAYGKRPRPGAGAVAVSDDGMYLLYGNGAAVELLGVAGDSRKLTDAAPGAVPVFAPGGHDAAVIDGQNLSLFRDAAGAATVRRLPGASGVKGADFSQDGKRLFVAGASVTTVDLASGERAELACSCKVAGLSRMGSAFRLTELGTGPLWLLDVASDPKIVFVPAVR
jgi:hypothetical protein